MIRKTNYLGSTYCFPSHRICLFYFKLPLIQSIIWLLLLWQWPDHNRTIHYLYSILHPSILPPPHPSPPQSKPYPTPPHTTRHKLRLSSSISSCLLSSSREYAPLLPAVLVLGRFPDIKAGRNLPFPKQQKKEEKRERKEKKKDKKRGEKRERIENWEGWSDEKEW